MPRLTVKRVAALLIPLLILGALVGRQLIRYKEKQAALVKARVARSTAPPQVTVAPAEIRDIVNTFESAASLEAPLTIKISPKVAGRVTFLQVHEGDSIHARQVLVRVDSDEVEAQVRQARANLAEAQYRLAQAQLMQSPTNVNVASQIKQQQAAVNSAQANLDNATIKYNRIFELYKQGFTAAQDVDDAKAAVTVQRAAVDVAQGQLQGAIASRDSAAAQKHSAEEQLKITRTQGAADAAVSGTNEIMSAVIASTWTVMVVFLPLLFIKGQARRRAAQRTDPRPPRPLTSPQGIRTARGQLTGLWSAVCARERPDDPSRPRPEDVPLRGDRPPGL